ncbi:alpha/beta hydrolase family domain-containing protein [Pochonia chlamydosporia 170]|uniref:Alpha/beta hydrolase family domain-containing protein n=1 Tax=Pochonia chlamydosporia 170 TaxID=1380566 RepID=A0A179FI79_METCM|nr:alpha/beta hydrolase family domain-containing protein [Pochonia chlamydosporia 170]OAQ65266.1 alpha/beta hydrolase family domain-containing protein [Pochonia chlamydosporia 170]
MTKPTIILVHGFWGDSAHWAEVIVLLNAKGYKQQAIEIPLTSLADDAERVQKAVKQVQDDVILVGHSYGGAVITEAGNLPNVVGLVYIAAFAPDKGESAASISAQYPAFAATENRLQPDSDGYLWIKTDGFHETFCQDVAKDKALVMAVTQKAPVASTFGDTITDPAWKAKPSWYQISKDDRCINPEAQKFMSSRIKAKKVIELNTGHASLASQPEAVTNLIDEAAGTAR